MRQTLRSLLILNASWLAVGAAGQTATLSQPTCGLIFDSFTHTLRPCLGTPGSATLGPPLREQVRFAAIAPSGTSALILAGFSAVQIVSLSGTAIDLGNAHGIAMAAWSPDSSSVSWNVASSPTIETVNVADPALIWSRELPSGSLAALAMSANGVVLAAMQDDLAAALYSFSSDAAPRLLTMCPPLAGLTLNQTTGNAYLLSADGLELSEVIDVYGTAAIVPFARLPEDRHPSAVIVDATHKRLYVSLASSPGLLGYNLETRTALEELPLDFTPVFFRTVRSGVFSMNPRTNDSDAFFVLDFQSEGQVFFIPPQN